MPINDSGTRDMAVRALAKIDQHMAVCDRRYEEWKNRQDQTLAMLREMNDKMIGLSEQIAEARGAGKMAKVIGASLAGIAGFLGGLGSHIMIK